MSAKPEVGRYNNYMADLRDLAVGDFVTRTAEEWLFASGDLPRLTVLQIEEFRTKSLPVFIGRARTTVLCCPVGEGPQEVVEIDSINLRKLSLLEVLVWVGAIHEEEAGWRSTCS